ncbi:FecCD family ABC transporter permease [Streptomyces marincola]|uniref:FecCD family ABC transporter permease n=1 Tax=Streptomyces marincola TaxID=2878388 RepID=UPI001CF55642|nr:iron chelate uptake ABC transporter family permease subunit [Streptomyces marincola]UCM86650.1 iron chelate uptake ABC transporter family permease subunit [Streptomyces marincola]
MTSGPATARQPAAGPGRAQAPPRAARRPAVLWAAAGAVALPLSALTAVTVGSADLPPGEVLRVIAGRLGAVGPAEPTLRETIVWDLRVPRVLLAALVGAGLTLCGTVLQALTRNPLADPYLLGVSSGASTGAVTVLVLGAGSGAALALPAGAFAGALLAFGCVLLLLGRALGGTTRVVLAGVVVSQLFMALTSLTVLWAGDAEQTRSMTFWLMGSLASATWGSVAVCAAAVAAGLVLCWSHAGALDALAFGREAAAGLGVRTRRTEIALYTGTAVLAGALVSASGAIGFVGLLVPHAARFLVGGRHRALLPVGALLGATFLVWADTAARTVFAPQEMPVGVLTALIGVPAFAVLLMRRVSAP